MKIKIVNGDGNKWYNEAVGHIFNAWEDERVPAVYFISWEFMVLKADAQIIKTSQKGNRTKEAYQQTN